MYVYYLSYFECCFAGLLDGELQGDGVDGLVDPVSSRTAWVAPLV